MHSQPGPSLCVSHLIGNLEACGMPASPPPEVMPHRDQALAADSLRLTGWGGGDGRDLAELRGQVSQDGRRLSGKGPAAPGALRREISEGNF